MFVKGLIINFDKNLFETFVNKTENSLKCLGIYFWRVCGNSFAKDIQLFEFRRTQNKNNFLFPRH